VELLESVKVVHVYGRLGEPHFASANGRDYIGKSDSHSIHLAASGIRLLTERTERTDEFEEAQRLITKAKKVCFLGFGYDETNIERLGILDILAREENYGKELYLCTYGLWENKVRDVKTLFREVESQSAAFVEYNNRDALSFLRRFPVLV
jgi:hypothetical protein